jgi:hypothetical protein
MVARTTRKPPNLPFSPAPRQAPAAGPQSLLAAADAVFQAVRKAKVACAFGGSFALHVHGFDLGRPPKDLDLVLFDDAPPARKLRDALRAAGCKKLPGERAFQELLVGGEAKCTLVDYELELQLPVVKATTARPHGRAAASRLIQRTRASITSVKGLPVISPQMVVAWKVVYGRDKDKRDLKTLIGITNTAGEPAITDANEVIECARPIKGTDNIAWANDLLFNEDHWFESNS